MCELMSHSCHKMIRKYPTTLDGHESRDPAINQRKHDQAQVVVGS